MIIRTVNCIKAKFVAITFLALGCATLFILLSIQNTLLNQTSIYDVDSRGAFNFQGLEVSAKQTPSQQLAGVVKIALINTPLKNIDVQIEPYSPNFSRLSEYQARNLIQSMLKVFTISHKQAWQWKLNDTFYAIKVYSSPGIYWDIAIVSVGFQHYIDALCFTLKLPGYESINLNNALNLLLKLSAKKMISQFS
jgi:hypothetical protein